MRRALLLGLAVIVVTGFVAGGLAAGAASRVRAPGQTLIVVQGPPEAAFVDLGDPGPSPGDLLVFRSELFDKTNTTRVGDLHINCSQNFGRLAVCLGIFRLDGRGRISVDALPQFPLPTTGMVTGGTDEFQRVRGEAHIEPQADGTTVITFHLFG